MLVPNELFEPFHNLYAIFNSPSLFFPSFEENGIAEPRLIKTIKKCNPRLVNIRETFTPAFYDQLCLIKSIISLRIEICSESFDFDCFLNLKYLKRISVSSETIPIDFICKMFKQLRFLWSFEYSCTLVDSKTFELVRFILKVYIFFKKRSELSHPFSLSCDYKGQDVSFKKNCWDVDELIREIKKIKEIALIKQFFF